MITAGEKVIRKDPRMRLNGQSLEIFNVSLEDAGEYICNVETFGHPLDQKHVLTVLVAPTIEFVPKKGEVTVKEESTVELQCLSKGIPIPHIKWSKKVNQGERLAFYKEINCIGFYDAHCERIHLKVGESV